MITVSMSASAEAADDEGARDGSVVKVTKGEEAGGVKTENRGKQV